MSFSPVSSFMIVRFLLQVLPCGFPTRNNRLQGNQPIVFDEAHEVDIVVTLDDEDPLTAVSLLVRVLQDVQHVPLSDEEHDLLEADAAVSLQLLVFRVVPGELLQPIRVSPERVPSSHTFGAAGLCPFLCPPTLEFGVFWYETLIGEKCEFVAGFIDQSASVRVRRRSRRRNC